MLERGDITRTIIDELYERTLVLADEVRAVFDLGSAAENGAAPDDMRIALSIEGLRTTTRVMHVLAWLLNQRAYLAGELSRLQMQRHGALADERPSDPTQMAHLLPETRALIAESEDLYDRVSRLDADWREKGEQSSSAVHGMHSNLSSAFAS
jgi:regulator of CtrA degradation